MNLIMLNTIVMVLYYGITLFFLAAILWNFAKTKDRQEALLYGIIMVPFVLRILRLK